MMSAAEVGELFRRIFDDFFAGNDAAIEAHPFVVHVRHRIGRRKIPEAVRCAVLASGRCVACGSVDRLEVDHIHPVSRGGSDDPANLQVLCKSCNTSKGAKTMSEWMART